MYPYDVCVKIGVILFFGNVIIQIEMVTVAINIFNLYDLTALTFLFFWRSQPSRQATSIAKRHCMLFGCKAKERKKKYL